VRHTKLNMDYDSHGERRKDSHRGMLEKNSSKFTFFPDLTNVMRKINLSNSSGLSPLQMFFLEDIMNKCFMSQKGRDFHCFFVHKPKEGGKNPITTYFPNPEKSQMQGTCISLCTWPLPDYRLSNKNAAANSDCIATYFKIFRCLSRS